jgi:hypothetical protein
LNLKIFYNFKGMDRPWMFCMSLSIANKTLCQQSNLTLIHSHNNVLTGAPKGGRKWGSNGLLSCPCQIWERITKNCTSSPSSSQPSMCWNGNLLWKIVDDYRHLLAGKIKGI